MSIDPAALMGQAAALDETLRERVIALANKALDEAEWNMIHGSPQVKTAIMRQFLQVFGKHLEVKAQDEELAKMREEWSALRMAIMGRVPGEVEDGELGEADVDRPSE